MKADAGERQTEKHEAVEGVKRFERVSGKFYRRFTLPETADDLVAWRLSNLSPQMGQALDLLAVAGQPLPAGVASLS